MKQELTVKTNKQGALQFNVNMQDAYLLKVIASLEEYLSKRIDLPISDIRDIVDEEKQKLTAKKLT